jgi:Zn-dependent protease with chaperone function
MEDVYMSRCSLSPFGIFHGHLVYFMGIRYMYLLVVWYIFHVLVLKSGNPEPRYENVLFNCVRTKTISWIKVATMSNSK